MKDLGLSINSFLSLSLFSTFQCSRNIYHLLMVTANGIMNEVKIHRDTSKQKSQSSLGWKVSGEDQQNGIYFSQPQGVFFYIRKSECWHNWTHNFKWEISSSHKWNCRQRSCFHISNLVDHFFKCWSCELERRKQRWVCLSKIVSQYCHFLTESASIMIQMSQHQARSPNKNRQNRWCYLAFPHGTSYSICLERGEFGGYASPIKPYFPNSPFKCRYSFHLLSVCRDLSISKKISKEKVNLYVNPLPIK